MKIFDKKLNTIENHITGAYRAIWQLYLEHGAEWQKVNVFGIRDEQNMNQDLFNDFICIATTDEVHLFKGTCDPSVYWTQVGGAAKDKKGVAHICYGYHKNVYREGWHFNQYALVQRAGKIKIWRDGNNNFRKDNSDIIQTGYFGVNIHTTSGEPSKIGMWSAGCQVIQRKKDFAKFMQIIKVSGQKKFSYFLFSKNQIPQDFWREFS